MAGTHLGAMQTLLGRVRLELLARVAGPQGVLNGIGQGLILQEKSQRGSGAMVVSNETDKPTKSENPDALRSLAKLSTIAARAKMK